MKNKMSVRSLKQMMVTEETLDLCLQHLATELPRGYSLRREAPEFSQTRYLESGRRSVRVLAKGQFRSTVMSFGLPLRPSILKKIILRATADVGKKSGVLCAPQARRWTFALFNGRKFHCVEIDLDSAYKAFIGAWGRSTVFEIQTVYKSPKLVVQAIVTGEPLS